MTFEWALGAHNFAKFLEDVADTWWELDKQGISTFIHPVPTISLGTKSWIFRSLSAKHKQFDVNYDEMTNYSNPFDTSDR